MNPELGWLGSIPVSIEVLHVGLRKRFNGFGIRLVKRGANG